MQLRFGITMRITNAEGYDEPRDTIAHDWSKYMTQAFPDSKYLFVPNTGELAVEYIKKWHINVLIISGGDDVGITPLRDKSETALLKYAIENGMPVIAVCRGLQLVHSFFGGKLLNGDNAFIKKHRATEHEVYYEDSIKVVNSYHNNYVDENTLTKDAKVLARCKSDNSVEAFELKNILALMWHPERDKAVNDWNKLLIEQFVNKIYGN